MSARPRIEFGSGEKGPQGAAKMRVKTKDGIVIEAARERMVRRKLPHAATVAAILWAMQSGAACDGQTIVAVRDREDGSITSGSGGPGGNAGAAGTAGNAGAAGTAGNGGAAGVAGNGGNSGSAGTAGSGGTAGAAGAGGTTGDDAGACTPSLRIREIDVGSAIVANENESALMPLVIAPIPSGGSRLAWMDASSAVHIANLDANDQLTGTAFTLPAHDLADLYADDQGGAVLISRAANGGGTGNCGTLTNLCGTNLPSGESCYDMYLVRFDGTTETWASKLTDSTRQLPPYSTSPTGPNVVFIWSAYAHHGRIAASGSRYAAYFGMALSSAEDCSSGGTNGKGINIYQADRMKLVDTSGALQTGGFDLGCSTSGYERVVFDPSANKFIAVCKNGNRIAIAPASSATTVYNFDAYYGNLGNIVLSPAGGYWLTTSNLQTGQPTGANGLADVHLLHFSTGMADSDLLVASSRTLNERAPHLAPFGANRLLVAWETSTATGELSASDSNRKFYLQAWNASVGTPDGPLTNVPGIVGNRYQEFRGFPDGSVAYPAPGSANTTIKILRVLPCPP